MFFGPMVKFCILQALMSLEDFARKKNSEKNAKFAIFTKFEAPFKSCSTPQFYSKFYFLTPLSAGKHF
jgi:hypothetical protein